MADTQRTAFIADKQLAERIKKIQEELKLDNPGEVLAMAISMIELSLGREVEFHDKQKTYRSNKFAKYNQTVIIDDDGDQTQ